MALSSARGKAAQTTRAAKGRRKVRGHVPAPQRPGTRRRDARTMSAHEPARARRHPRISASPREAAARRASQPLLEDIVDSNHVLVPRVARRLPQLDFEKAGHGHRLLRTCMRAAPRGSERSGAVGRGRARPEAHRRQWRLCAVWGVGQRLSRAPAAVTAGLVRHVMCASRPQSHQCPPPATARAATAGAVTRRCPPSRRPRRWRRRVWPAARAPRARDVGGWPAARGTGAESERGTHAHVGRRVVEGVHWLAAEAGGAMACAGRAGHTSRKARMASGFIGVAVGGEGRAASSLGQQAQDGGAAGHKFCGFILFTL